MRIAIVDKVFRQLLSAETKGDFMASSFITIDDSSFGMVVLNIDDICLIYAMADSSVEEKSAITLRSAKTTIHSKLTVVQIGERLRNLGIKM